MNPAIQQKIDEKAELITQAIRLKGTDKYPEIMEAIKNLTFEIDGLLGMRRRKFLPEAKR